MQNTTRLLNEPGFYIDYFLFLINVNIEIKVL